MERIQTGNRSLDAAFAGGIAPGTVLLLRGEEGAGATEFALTVLRSATRQSRGARFASALRSPRRVRHEYAELFEDGDGGLGLEVKPLLGEMARADPAGVLGGLRAGDVLVLESADALAPPGDGVSLLPFWREVADAAGEAGVVLLLLDSPGTLPPAVDASLAEAADGVLEFTWKDGGPVRRRVLALTKLRGLAPALDGGEVPVFEVALHRGVGFTVSRGKSVL
ncbi:MAG TPA: hypothetical protein VNX21_07645 [Candidatus Thermoplasmatota archaeon]|nr:hypothetical protein [Candidatus Thermoplasmatota archaeon]